MFQNYAQKVGSAIFKIAYIDYLHNFMFNCNTRYLYCANLTDYENMYLYYKCQIIAVTYNDSS